MPRLSSTTPGRSNLRGTVPPDSRSTRAEASVSSSADNPISQYVARQLITEYPSPDTSGPARVPSPIMAPYRPVARTRSDPAG